MISSFIISSIRNANYTIYGIIDREKERKKGSGGDASGSWWSRVNAFEESISANRIVRVSRIERNTTAAGLPAISNDVSFDTCTLCVSRFVAWKRFSQFHVLSIFLVDIFNFVLFVDERWTGYACQKRVNNSDKNMLELKIFLNQLYTWKSNERFN